MGRVKFELHPSVDDDRSIYLSGSFNDWKAEDKKFKLKKQENGIYSLEVDLSSERFPVLYKYVKGNWGNEELDIWGNPIDVRKLKKGHHPHDTVVRWRKNGMICDDRFMPNKFIIEEDFEIPQLGKRRNIWALIPHDYEENDHRYPVLYLQDAQNLCNPNAPFGNWAIDQRLAIMAEHDIGDLIIIAIEHGGEERLKEYSPFDTAHFGVGEGKSYAKFMVETLKPYVDGKFRTRPEREFTGIGGSSMGGLISVYAGLIHNEIFSKWMIFSPSLWVSSKIYSKAMQFSGQLMTSVYLYGGKLESNFMERDLQLFKDILKSKGIENELLRMKLSINPRGRHNEKHWGEEFPRAVKWLFFDT